MKEKKKDFHTTKNGNTKADQEARTKRKTSKPSRGNEETE